MSEVPRSDAKHRAGDEFVRPSVRARFPPDGHGRSKAGTRWTPALVDYGLDRFHRRHLRAPTQREVRAGIVDLPSYATVQRHYGSFGKMLRAHGYLPRSRGGSRGRPCTLERDHHGRFLPSDAVTPESVPADGRRGEGVR